MRALRPYGKGDIRVEEIPRPQMKPGHTRIAPAFVGICGTDLHEYETGPNFAPLKPHPVTGETVAIGFGHEFSGNILETGALVDGNRYPIGAKCLIQPTISCGKCEACNNDAENACPDGGFLGLSGSGGGLSDEVLVPAAQVFLVPDKISLDVAALVEPLAVAYYAVDASPVRKIPPSKASAPVLGGRPVGLAVIQCLRAIGTTTIVVSEVAKRRQEFAQQMGAHHVLYPMKDDVVARCQKLSRGLGGVDVVFDCAGLPAAIRAACHAIKSTGTVVNVVIWHQETMFNPNWLVLRKGKYIGTLGYQGKDYTAVIQALEEGKIDAFPMIAEKIALKDIVDKDFKPLLTEKDKHVKILVDLRAE